MISSAGHEAYRPEGPYGTYRVHVPGLRVQYVLRTVQLSAITGSRYKSPHRETFGLHAYSYCFSSFAPALSTSLSPHERQVFLSTQHTCDNTRSVSERIDSEPTSQPSASHRLCGRLGCLANRLEQQPCIDVRICRRVKGPSAPPLAYKEASKSESYTQMSGDDAFQYHDSCIGHASPQNGRRSRRFIPRTAAACEQACNI